MADKPWEDIKKDFDGVTQPPHPKKDGWLTDLNPVAREIAEQLPLCPRLSNPPELFGAILPTVKPDCPDVGDSYYSQSLQMALVWNGLQWCMYSS